MKKNPQRPHRRVLVLLLGTVVLLTGVHPVGAQGAYTGPLELTVVPFPLAIRATTTRPNRYGEFPSLAAPHVRWAYNASCLTSLAP